MLVESNDAESIKFGRSIKGLNWKFEEGCDRTLRTMCQKLNIPMILAKILYNRGITTAEEAEPFLDPKIKYLMPDPFALKDMKKAVIRVIDAIKARQKICVYGDYDVDGATSSALLRRLFRDIGLEAGIYIPDRLKEGYGPNTNALKIIQNMGYELVIIVDCGTTSFIPLADAKKMGLDVIVIDHHLGQEQLPEAVAVVNPNRFDEDFPYKSMAAVGVVFMFTVALMTELRHGKWFQTSNIQEPDLLQYLDLVALGTICDVMTLNGINRAFVVQGLKIIAQRRNIGIATLANLVKLDSAPQPYHLGYVFGPRVNAGGRVGDGILGSNLLTTECPIEAYDIALKLEKYNNERKEIESKALAEAIEQIETGNLYDDPIILVKSADWHLGILGVLASKLKDRYKKPTAVMSIRDDIAKGSGRSIPGVDLGSALASAKSTGLLLEGGGHAMAGGFTVAISKLTLFAEYIMSKVNMGLDTYMKARDLHIDYILSISSLNDKLIDTVGIAEPYGSGNPAPRFALYNVIISHAMIVGGNHVMIHVIEGKSVRLKRQQKCILFQSVDTPLGQFLLKGIGKRVSLVGAIQINYFNKKKVDFIIEDVATHED